MRAANTIFLCALVSAATLETWYVKPDAVDSNGCHANVTGRTLAYYVKNQQEYFINNTRLVLLPGTHRLSAAVLAIAGISNLSLCGNWPQCKGKAEVHCDGNSGLTFSNSKNIVIKNINFISCSASISQLPYAALSFDRVSVITIENVKVVNSTGYGVYGTQIEDKVIVQNSTFSGTHAHKNVGGNARLSFHENCSSNAKNLLLIQSSEFLNGSNNFTNTASGLTIDGLCPGMIIHLDNVTARSNQVGNIQLNMSNIEARNWEIIVNNSVIAGENDIKASGLNIKSKLYHQYYCDGTASSNDGNSMNIVGTKFIRSTSRALNIKLYDSDCKPTNIMVHECSFHGNTVSDSCWLGAAFTLQNYPTLRFYTHSMPLYHLNITDSCFHNNIANGTKASIVKLKDVEKAHIKNCNFTGNMGTAIALTSSNVILTGNIIFDSNTATNGGALRFCDSSSMFLNNGTHVIFRKNHANQTGGAIFAQDSCLDERRACFFQPVVEPNTPIEDLATNYQIKLTFEGNTAKEAGDAIYGGEIDNCYTYIEYNNGSESDHYFSKEVFDVIFSDVDDSKISSEPYKVKLCGHSEDFEHGTPIEVIPGIIFNIGVLAEGQRSGVGSAIITAELAHDNPNFFIIPTGYPMPTRLCANLSLILKTTVLYNNVTTIEIGLNVQNSRPQSQLWNSNSKYLNLSVQPCPWGFVFDNVTQGCGCSKYFLRIYDCNFETLTVKIISNRRDMQWIGCEKDSTSRDCTNKELLFAYGCGQQEYCNSTNSGITADHADDICASHRTGILCGSCVPGYSVVLGSGRCKSCPPSNAYLSLVVIYLGAGILLITILTKFRLTVNNGSLNGLIFYANFIHWNRHFFFPRFFNSDILRLIIAWLNLDLGVEVCLYNGMTALHLIWLEIGYILYIVFLQFVIILLCRRYVIFTRFFGRNVTKVMSTLVVLLYAKTLSTVATVFTYTQIYYTAVHDYKISVLSVDGNIRYGSHQHIPLLVVASLLALLLTMFTFSLLFIQILIKVSSWRCFKWVVRFQPFFETITGPCNFNYAFWPGYLFFIRYAYVVIVSQLVSQRKKFYASTNNSILVGGCTIITIIFSLLGPKGAYKKWSLNIMEFSLMLNLSITCLVVSRHWVTWSNRIIISHISVVIALAFFLVYHARRLKRAILALITHFKTSLAKCSRIHRQELPVAVTHTDVTLSTSVPAERTPLLPAQIMPPVMNYDKFREPLVEDC